MIPTGTWWAAVPSEDWGHPEGERPDQKENWHPRFGDRAQSLVFIGQQLDEAAMRARLDACLLDDQALDQPHEWRSLPNPFPPLPTLDESSESSADQPSSTGVAAS